MHACVYDKQYDPDEMYMIQCMMIKKVYNDVNLKYSSFIVRSNCIEAHAIVVCKKYDE